MLQGDLLDELLLGLVDLVGVRAVHVVPEAQQGHGQGVPDGVVLPDLLRVLLVPEDVPAVHLFVHHLGVVEDAHGAPHIGQGVLVAGIEGVGHLVHPVGDVLLIGDLAHIEGHQQIVLDELFDDIVGGEAHVVGVVCGAELDEHLLVAGHLGIVHLDAGLLLKEADELGVDVLAPVQHVQLAADLGILIPVGKAVIRLVLLGVLFLAGHAGEHHQSTQQQSKPFLHFIFLPYP